MSITVNAVKNKVRGFSKVWILLIIIMLLVAFVRIRLLDFPLERDEGEYAYMGQLILQGIPPYAEAYNMKFPGTYVMYALFMAVFGETSKGIHLGLLTVNFAAIILVYILARKIVDDLSAAIAGGAYGLLSLSSSVFGFAAHATHFVVLSALCGTLLLLYASEREKTYLYFLSGVLFGLSVIMKQPGIFFVLFGAAYILWGHFFYSKADSYRKLALKLGAFFLGAALPILITFLWLYAAGVFGRFWFWTIDYASKYGAQIPLSAAFPSFSYEFSFVVGDFSLFWIIAGLGLIESFFRPGLRTGKSFILLFTLFSFLSVCPGFYFRPHYFVTFLPAVSLLFGIFCNFLMSRGFVLRIIRRPGYLAVGLFIAAATIGIAGGKEYFFVDEPAKLSRTIYGANPFPESVEIANFIKANSAVTDRIAVLGSEPQLFFYSGRRSATGYIYTYSLMEEHDYALTMQKEMAAEIESTKPKLVVLVQISTSWLQRPDSEKFILLWIDDYLNRNYTLVGVADIISPDLTVYKWNDDARNYSVLSPASLLVYERK